MKWLQHAAEEILPVLGFFVVQRVAGFTEGIVAMVVILIALLAMSRLRGSSIPKFAVVSTVAFLIFAVPSILTGNSVYFKLSDTVLDGFFALLLLGSWWINYPILKIFFEKLFAISDAAWHILSFRWGMLFLVLALTNEYIRQVYGDNIWSYYKLISTVGILLFGCYQFTLSKKERIVGESNWLGLRT